MQYKYKFSIIMSIYNVEQYIKEAIDSVIEQSLDFQENVQLILVNDGSPDKCNDICRRYVEKYPDNIEYHEKINEGLPSARNYGLKFVRGKYVNFFDPDDILSKDTLNSVLSFFNKNPKINIAGLVVEYFGAKFGIHPRYEKFGKETTVVSLVESPQNYILSSAATFYSANLFDNIKFDTSLEIAEDLFLNCQLYFDNKNIGIIGHNEAVYYYRVRKENVSLTGKKKYDLDSFIEVTNYLYNNFIRILDEKKMDMPEFLKYILLAEIKKKNKALNMLKNDDKILHFHEICKKILLNIEDKYISNFYDQDHMVKISFLCLKYGWNSKNIEYKIHDNKLYANNLKVGNIKECKIILSKCEISDKHIKLIGVYNDILPINANSSLRFKDNKGITYSTNFKHTDNRFFLNKVMGLEFNNPYKFDITIDICNAIKYRPILKVAGIEIPIKFISMGKNFAVENFVSDEEILKFRNRKKLIEINNYEIKILNKTVFNVLKYSFERIKYIKKFFDVKWIYRFMGFRNKKYVLFNDRPLVGDDNAQALFEYICRNEKKFSRNCYFVISKDSKNYKELKKIGKVIIKDSLIHKFKFLNAKIIISSHAAFYSPFNVEEMYCYRDILNYKFVFLQHGVTMNNVHLPINKCKSGIDMFITSTHKEYEEVMTDKYMYNDEVVLTGLPRFDKLKNEDEKIILIAPTWRTFLSGKINKLGFHDIVENFNESEYYMRYSSLLKNDKLLNILKDNGYKIIFLLHPGFKLYKELFIKLTSNIVEIKDFEEVKYSELFSKLSLLVTDYSSIIFDVAYLKKPMLLYQFDSKDYFEKHYKPGYFSYKEDGFGKIVTEENELVEEIIKNIESKCRIDKFYKNRIENTFKYIDKNNSKRVYEEIRKRFFDK